MQSAIYDLHGRKTKRSDTIARAAREWFLSESDEPGSFLWTCLILDLDAQAVRAAVLEKPEMCQAACDNFETDKQLLAFFR